MNQFHLGHRALNRPCKAPVKTGQNLINAICVLGLSALLQGCAFISYESVYEGIRGADKTKTTGTTQTPATLPNHDRYEKERETLKK